MTISATCPGCGPLYTSSEIKGQGHAINARLKAQRIAQKHAEENGGHVVEVSDGATVGLVACRCARCGKDTPGNASGLCPECVFARLDTMLKENAE